MKILNPEQATHAAHRQARRKHWNEVAKNSDLKNSRNWSRYYHKRVTQIYQFIVAPGKSILEIGCGQGDLLAALKPARGVGVDFSEEILCRAREKHPELHFLQADAQSLALNTTFDVIILSDLVNDVWDVQTLLEQLSRLATPRTRLLLNMYSRLWEQPLALTKRFGLAKPTLYQNWLTVEDITNLLYLADFEVIQQRQEIIWPFSTPFLDLFFNHFLVKLWPFNQLALTNLIVARLQQQKKHLSQEPLVSVVIPARNEAGNIPQIFKRTPKLGRGTELIFVEGHSKDDTYAVIAQESTKHPECQCKLLKQTGIGKGDAVKLGFAHAEGEILMILDADLTVPPEDLPRFYNALLTGKGDFINGVRLVYPMEKRAMRFLNLVGNKFFSLAFSWLLGQSIKDTLCGTKALWKKDYALIAANRAYFGDFDPFGDFDLLFGAAKLNLKIVDLPIRYRERAYGETNIHRWKHGWLLLKMASFAARRIKFV